LNQTEILGDYSTAFKHKSRSASQPDIEKIYWFVSRRGTDYRAAALSDACLPTEVRKTIDAQELMNEFNPEPRHFYRNTLPAIRRYLSEQTEDASRTELLKRLGCDITDAPTPHETLKKLMADFFEQAQSILERQTGHICAHCVTLRKEGRLEEALRLYQKALEFTPSDENLHFNIARVYFDRGDYSLARKHLHAALDLNGEFKPAKSFLNFLAKVDQGIVGGNGSAKK
jgi:tetratricopeptide (TPR) repeat protein